MPANRFRPPTHAILHCTALHCTALHYTSKLHWTVYVTLEVNTTQRHPGFLVEQNSSLNPQKRETWSLTAITRIPWFLPLVINRWNRAGPPNLFHHISYCFCTFTAEPLSCLQGSATSGQREPLVITATRQGGWIIETKYSTDTPSCLTPYSFNFKELSSKLPKNHI